MAETITKFLRKKTYYGDCVVFTLCCSLQGDSKRGGETGGGSAVGHEDSDLERKRREAEALLQSVGITPDIHHGTYIVPGYFCFFHSLPLVSVISD